MKIKVNKQKMTFTFNLLLLLKKNNTSDNKYRNDDMLNDITRIKKKEATTLK
jgi:hypothetical protein